MQHDYNAISEAPKPEAGLEVMRQYSRAAFGAKSVANWLRGLGWDAEPLTGPMSGKVTLIPPALASGFGELGKHGSIINPEFGASIKAGDWPKNKAESSRAVLTFINDYINFVKR